MISLGPDFIIKCFKAMAFPHEAFVDNGPDSVKQDYAIP